MGISQTYLQGNSGVMPLNNYFIRLLREILAYKGIHRQTGLESIIGSLGLYAEVGERGTNLSEGQRQAVSAP